VQSALIFAIIAVGALGQGAAILTLFRERLLSRHVAFLGFTLLAFTRSLASVVSRGHLHPYFEIWKATQWPLALLGAAVAVEAFWRLALHFRNVRGFGLILLSGLICLGATSAWLVAAINSKWDGPLHGPLMFEECAEISLVVVVLVSLGFFRLIPSVPIRANAVQHILILTLLYGSSFVGNFVALASRGTARFTANLIITSGLAVSYWWWTLRMTRSGEKLPFALPAVTSDETLQALDALDRRLYAEGNAMKNDLEDRSRSSKRRDSTIQR
jgi:hypothetical protein